MPPVAMQEEILKTLAEESQDLTMSELIKKRGEAWAKTGAMRAAVLTLILTRRVEWTPERKLRLVRDAV